jgi:hypothetical protein
VHSTITGINKQDQLDQFCHQLRKLKFQHGLYRVVVFWTASTEQCADVIPDVNETANALLKPVPSYHEDWTLHIVRGRVSILEGEPSISGAIQFAERPAHLLAGTISDSVEVHPSRVLC